jgi:hypothetical protein
LPHIPQCDELFVVLVSQPLFGLPSQLAKPALQFGAQTPFEHATPPFGFVHCMPQPPQWLVLVLVLVSQPLFGLPSQLPDPELQLGTHDPPMHAVVPLLLVHAVPHVPQWPVVVFKFVSHPFALFPSQLPQPAEHTGAHAPATQLVLPCAFVHALPQVPQWLVVFVTLVSQPLLALPSQLPNPGLHDGTQEPAMQAVPPFGFVH